MLRMLLAMSIFSQSAPNDGSYVTENILRKREAMIRRITLSLALLLLMACSFSEAPGSASAHSPISTPIPEPPTWAFPEIMEAALEVVSVSIEGRPFNRYGLPYSLEELDQLDVRKMEAQELQNYADAITHAYPDALGRQIAAECGDSDLGELSNRAVVGVAYVSLNAIDPEIREHAAACLAAIQSGR